MKMTSVACVMLGFAAAPAAGFMFGATGRGLPGAVWAAPQGLTSSRQQVRSRAPLMAIDPHTVHSVSDYVNVVSSGGMDQAWLTHVWNGEQIDAVGEGE